MEEQIADMEEQIADMEDLIGTERNDFDQIATSVRNTIETHSCDAEGCCCEGLIEKIRSNSNVMGARL